MHQEMTRQKAASGGEGKPGGRRAPGKGNGHVGTWVGVRAGEPRVFIEYTEGEKRKSKSVSTSAQSRIRLKVAMDLTIMVGTASPGKIPCEVWLGRRSLTLMEREHIYVLRRKTR